MGLACDPSAQETDLHGSFSLLSEFQASERLTEKQGGQYPRLFPDLYMCTHRSSAGPGWSVPEVVPLPPHVHTEAQLGLGLDLAWVLVSTLEPFARPGCLGWFNL